MSTPQIILLVEDDADLCRVIKSGLETAGFAVHVAENGRIALDNISEIKPDLILLDLMMPVMTGIEFCKSYIEGIGEVDLPVIVISGASEKSRFMRDFFEMPIPRRGFLKKPFRVNELEARIREMLGMGGSGAGTPRPAAATPPPGPAKRGARTPAEDNAEPEPPQPNYGPRHAAPAASRAAAEPTAAPSAKDEETDPGLGIGETVKEQLPPELVKPPLPPMSEEKERLRILCIDDDEDIRALLRITLSQQHDVKLAENGMAALEVLETFDPDFVISDFDMPTMNGIQTIEAIRKHPRYQEIPVFMLTGERETKLPRKLFEAGGNLFLQKPIDPLRILKIIDHFVHTIEMKPRPPVNIPIASPIETGTVAGKDTPRSGTAKKQATITAPAAPQPVGPKSPPRILTVDKDPVHREIITGLFTEESHDPVDLFWADDPQTALVHLARWEPDIILYNPRQKNMDGIAFTQSLRLKKLLAKMELAFVGIEFFDSDQTFSQKTFKRDVIRLDAPPNVILAAVDGVIRAAANKMGVKRYSMPQLQSMEKDNALRKDADQARADAQREHFKGRFKGIQEFIDKENLSM